MGTEEEWLLRPVHRGFMTYTDLLEGRVDLKDILRCNAYLDVIDENEAKLTEAMNKDVG